MSSRWMWVPFLVLCAVVLAVGCGGGDGGGGTDDGGTDGGATDDGGGPGSIGFPPGITTWLERLNQMRSWAGLPPVTEDPVKSTNDTLHATYLVLNCESGHEETIGNPGYTAAGHDAGLKSNVATAFVTALTDEEVLRAWLTGPFHGIGMLDPRFLSGGFGKFFDSAKDCAGGFPGTYAAALWTDFGSTPVPPGTIYPIKWPEAVIDILSFSGEFPDPLTSCPAGWVYPTGLTLFLQLGVGPAAPPTMGPTSFSVSGGGGTLEHCIIHWGNYTNGVPADEALGRAILEARQCIALIPRAPLTPGTTYDVSITANAVTTAWSFSTSATAVKPTGPSKTVIR